MAGKKEDLVGAGKLANGLDGPARPVWVEVDKYVIENDRQRFDVA